VGLTDELIEAPLAHAALALGVGVGAVVITRRCPIDTDAEADGCAIGSRPEHLRALTCGAVEFVLLGPDPPPSLRLSKRKTPLPTVWLQRHCATQNYQEQPILHTL
jgi:hypothetical protein